MELGAAAAPVQLVVVAMLFLAVSALQAFLPSQLHQSTATAAAATLATDGLGGGGAAFSAALSGSGEDSYLVLPAWQPCLNASLAFEFNASRPSGLLLYAELFEITAGGDRFKASGKAALFLHVSLVRGRLKVRLNLGGNFSRGPDGNLLSSPLSVVSLGEDGGGLADGRFVRAGISLRADTAQVTAGNASTTLRVSARGRATRVTSDSLVYFGGLPPRMKLDARERALYTVPFEEHFAGHLRNIVYQDCPIAGGSGGGGGSRDLVVRAPSPLAAGADATEFLQAASSGSQCGVQRCRHAGVCLVGGGCLCQPEFAGDNCQMLAQEWPTTFDGRGYIYLDLGPDSLGIYGNSDTISLLYRTRQTDAFLFYVGEAPAANTALE